jgi:hypothetical protein
MRFKVILTQALVVACVSRAASAQTEGPVAGTWAVEGGPFGGGGLMHFRSPTSATMIGVSAYFTRMDDGSGSALTFVSSQLRLGLRSYGESRNNVRRFSTLSGILGFERDDNPGENTWLVGAAWEIGAAYFFTPHVSMGGSGDLNATYGFGGGAGGGDRAGISISGFRLLGTVYF